MLALKHENETLKRTLADDSRNFWNDWPRSKDAQIIETIRTAAPSDASVLIEGESGTGKELIAEAFHTQSQHASGPFIRINCAAIPHELIESELFGYKKGAFTGADHDKRGLIEAARDGTLLLDEIAEMPHICRPSCCESYRSESCGGWVTSERSMLIFVSSQRRTATRWSFWKRALCARTFTSVSAQSRSRYRLCVNGSMMCR